ncbi:MAG: hypothetical protein M3Y53_08525, partial [Thermoproteota archaeon]|nr:hypothetical protein [Thermoproteota archaeon]
MKSAHILEVPVAAALRVTGGAAVQEDGGGSGCGGGCGRSGGGCSGGRGGTGGGSGPCLEEVRRREAVGGAAVAAAIHRLVV